MVRDIAQGITPENAGAAAPAEPPAPAEPEAVKKQMDDAAAVFASHPPVWPVVVTWAVFGYLWWLGVLIFDLAFVWHRYVRSEVALDNLRKQRGLFKEKTGATPSASAGAGGPPTGASGTAGTAVSSGPGAEAVQASPSPAGKELE
jgi:hypothetical protein